MNKNKVYIDIELNEEPIQKMLDYFEKINNNAKELKENGVSKRNINKLIKKCLKFNK